MINRQKFAEAAENKYKTVKYKETDCQAFIEECAKEAGYKFNARGTNDIWRNYMAAKGYTSAFALAVGDVVFKWRKESNRLPERYRGDNDGDIYHIGIVTGLNPFTVCHSANSKENGKKETYDTQAALSEFWQLCGTLKNTDTSTLDENAYKALLENDAALYAYLKEWVKNYETAQEWYRNNVQ